jgi:hypothetical protein
MRNLPRKNVKLAWSYCVRNALCAAAVGRNHFIAPADFQK